jgi:hypothetical protein
MPADTPNQQAQLGADTAAFMNQSRLARRISGALSGFGDAAAEGEGLSLQGSFPQDAFTRQLGRQGALTAGAQAGLDREAAQREGAFSDPRARALMGGPNSKAAVGQERAGLARTARGRRSRLAGAANKTQREDLANIFGRNLQQQAAISSLTSGTLEEDDPPRSSGDRFMDTVNDVIGAIFG